jgi:hypothetical protein
VNLSDAFGTLIAAFGLTACVVFSFLTYRFLRKNFVNLREDKLLELWSSYYAMMTT